MPNMVLLNAALHAQICCYVSTIGRCVYSQVNKLLLYRPIDFSKAFDVVSHTKLFARLHSYGVRGPVLQWIQNFLSKRTHQTKVETYLSDTAWLINGVVQGSGIGPLLFLIYI